MIGRFARYEHMSPDPDAARTFYDNVLGAAPGTYSLGPTPSYWLCHLHVASATASCDRVKELGGHVLDEASMIVTDSLGAVFALTEHEHDAWIWTELYSADPAKSIAFYSALVGWTADSLTMDDQGIYHVLKHGGIGHAGIISVPGVGPSWMPYARVTDCDAIVARARELGARIANPGEDVQNVGRLAIFVDPLGAPIGLLQPSAR